MRISLNPGSNAWLVPTVFSASVLVTLVFWLLAGTEHQPNQQNDYHSFYEPVARRMLAGQGLSQANEQPAIKYPPGYPLTLAGLFAVCHWLNVSEEAGLRVLAILSAGLVSVFVFLLANTIWEPIPALVASLVWMMYPFALWLTKEPNSEVPFMVVLYGALYLYWRSLLRRSSAWPVYFACGMLVGFAMLIRPIALGMGVVFGLVIWFTADFLPARFRLFFIAMLLLGNLTAVLPWETWVYAKTGKVVLLSTNGVTGVRDGLMFAVKREGYYESSTVSSDVAAVMDSVYAHAKEIVTPGDVFSILAREMRDHPVALLKLFMLKMMRSWYGTADNGRKEKFILLIQVAYLLPVIWGGSRAWKQGGNSRKFASGVFMIILYWWGMTVLALSILRYMVPVMGLLFILMAGALSSIGHGKQKRNES